MNARTRTISINPAMPTAAEKAGFVNRDTIETLMRDSTFRFDYDSEYSKVDSHDSLRAFISLLFGVSGKRDGLTAPMDSFTLVSRICLGGFLIFCGMMSELSLTGIGIIILGGMLMGGLFTRPAMLGFGTLQAIQWHTMVQTGSVSAIVILLTVSAFLIALLGPGHISIDSAMEYGISESLKDSHRRKMRARRVSYEAYRYSGF